MKVATLFIDDNVFETFLAISAEEQAKGLMFEEWPPPTMTFIYKRAQVNYFWMKNTVSPLDILFVNSGKIIHMSTGIPNSLLPIGNGIPSDLVIELPKGSIKRFDITYDSKVKLVQ